jgi:hypothetical protein
MPFDTGVTRVRDGVPDPGAPPGIVFFGGSVVQ